MMMMMMMLMVSKIGKTDITENEIKGNKIELKLKLFLF